MRVAVGRGLQTVSRGLWDWTHSSSVDLAVTGLSRAGKTVFITSLVQNLLCTGSGKAAPKGALAAFEPFANGRLRNVILPPAGAGSRPRFPFEECIEALSAESPAWPRRTGAVSEIELRLQFGRQPLAAGVRDRHTANVTLRLVDYPGEWLLDLPLLGQTFEQWSAKALAMSCRGSRVGLSQRWQALITERPLTAPAEDAFARRAAEAYRDYLVECRAKGLRFLQPGQFLRLPGQDEEDSRPVLDRPQLWFCPLPPAPAGKWPAGSIGAAMERRYEAYCSETVKGFMNDTFGRFGRQLVLVDVLGALSAGSEAFNDTCDALAEVSTFLRESSDSLWSRIKDLRISPRIDKIAFAAAQADHVPGREREHLAELLGRMLRQEAGLARWRGTELLTTYIASVCSTEEERVALEGHAYDAVVGRRIDTGRRAKVIVAPIPRDIPDRAYWERCERAGSQPFDFPIFQPPPINPQGLGGIPQIGMERLLNFLIGDRFK
jgi:predicted YcjX-like family ATPase